MKDEEVGGRERLLGVLLAHCDAEKDGDRPTADVDLGISLRRRTDGDYWPVASNGTLPVPFFFIVTLIRPWAPFDRSGRGSKRV
jgi:hypothetical protein